MIWNRNLERSLSLAFLGKQNRRSTVSDSKLEGQIRPKSFIIIAKFRNPGEKVDIHVNRGCTIEYINGL